jgi:hypothetical protein
MQFKSDLNIGDWTDLTDLVAANSTQSLVVTYDGGQHYFRLPRIVR